MGDKITFLAGIELSVVSMCIVFFLLYAISLVLSSFDFLANRMTKQPEEKKETAVEKEVVKETVKQISFADLEKDEDMLVAALVASMEIANECKDKNFRIVNIKEI